MYMRRCYQGMYQQVEIKGEVEASWLMKQIEKSIDSETNSSWSIIVTYILYIHAKSFSIGKTYIFREIFNYYGNISHVMMGLFPKGKDFEDCNQLFRCCLI